MKVFEELLSEVEYENYLIDYSHPMILSQKALFVIGSGFSNCMVNSYFQGVLNIEFTSYDPGLYERYGQKSYGGKMADFFFLEKDWGQLDSILQQILKGDIVVQRDKKYMSEEFPDTSKESWLFWDELFAQHGQN